MILIVNFMKNDLFNCLWSIAVHIIHIGWFFYTHNYSFTEKSRKAGARMNSTMSVTNRSSVVVVVTI